VSLSETPFQERELAEITLMLIGFGRLFTECLLKAAPELRIVEAGSAKEEILQRLGEKQPDIVTIDVGAMNGQALDIVRAVADAAPEVKVIAFGLEPAQATILQWIEAGANGYLPRDASLAELKSTLHHVSAGKMPATPEMAFALFARLAELARVKRRANILDTLILTQRELDVLRLIANGLPNHEIAARLSLSFHTVKNHVQNIFKKIDVTRRTEAVERARRQGWLDE
jgi:DNA-binding NarL/FixJ family response regulator